MRPSLFLPILGLLLSTSACSQAQDKKHKQSKTAQEEPDDPKLLKGGDRRKNKTAAEAIPGLTRVGSMKGMVPESSGLCRAETPGTYYSFGDDGNSATLYQIDGTGKLVKRMELATTNTDWESISRDEQGNYYLGDCGNNDNLRRNLAIHRFRPGQPTKVQDIKFKYPDQTAFPPEKKKDRNFDCEASLWHGGQVWLFTKDRGQSAACKVYSVPDAPGTYTAKLVTTLDLPGQVTDATLSPNGHRLILLGRGELFVLDGNSWEEILRAQPHQVSLAGAGQTEGAAFKDDNTLLISTEQGGLYEYTLPK